ECRYHRPPRRAETETVDVVKSIPPSSGLSAFVVLRFADNPAPSNHANVGEWNRTTDAPAVDGATTASAPHWPPCGILSDRGGHCGIATTGGTRMDTVAK